MGELQRCHHNCGSAPSLVSRQRWNCLLSAPATAVALPSRALLPVTLAQVSLPPLCSGDEQPGAVAAPLGLEVAAATLESLASSSSIRPTSRTSWEESPRVDGSGP